MLRKSPEGGPPACPSLRGRAHHSPWRVMAAGQGLLRVLPQRWVGFRWLRCPCSDEHLVFCSVVHQGGSVDMWPALLTGSVASAPGPALHLASCHLGCLWRMPFQNCCSNPASGTVASSLEEEGLASYHLEWFVGDWLFFPLKCLPPAKPRGLGDFCGKDFLTVLLFIFLLILSHLLLTLSLPSFGLNKFWLFILF